MMQSKTERIQRRKYNWHQQNARRRAIPFLFSFEEWIGVWLASGRWHERGNRKGQYVMARFGDTGSYAFNNVKIITASENRREATLGKPKSTKTRQRMSKPKSPEHRRKIAICNKLRGAARSSICAVIAKAGD